MIVLPSRRAREASVPFLFRASDCIDDAGIFALGYGQRLARVNTPASRKRVVDQNGRLFSVPNGAPALSTVGGKPTVLLEGAATNLCIRSAELDTWTLQFSATVTANATTAPDGTLTADLVTGGGVGESGIFRDVTFTGDGEKGLAFHVKAGTSPSSDLMLFDTTASVVRARVRLTWTAGVPAAALVSGGGTVYPVESLGNGWYRVLFSVASVVAANTNRQIFYPHNLAGFTGSCYAWGLQAENAAVPSSYIPTAASTVARAADSLYFPFTLPPTAMTLYVRGTEGYRANDALSLTQGLMYIGAVAGADPTVGLINRSGSAGYSAYHDPAALSISGAVGTAVTRGDLVELFGGIRTTGAAFGGISVNGGAASLAADGGAQALAAAWSDVRLWLNSQGSNNVGQFAFTHACVALGVQSLDTMRELAGV